MTYQDLLNSMPDFRVHTYESENGLVVECHGKLISDHAMQFRDEVRKLIPGQTKVILDMKGVPQWTAPASAQSPRSTCPPALAAARSRSSTPPNKSANSSA